MSIAVLKAKGKREKKNPGCGVLLSLFTISVCLEKEGPRQGVVAADRG
jgi:hypothetical protein